MVGYEESGWIVEHPRYGKWFISREAVAANWKRDYAQAYPGEPVPEPSAADVDVWFFDQTSWIEVAANGQQLARPDMAAVEAAWLREMAACPDCAAMG